MILHLFSVHVVIKKWLKEPYIQKGPVNPFLIEISITKQKLLLSPHLFKVAFGIKYDNVILHANTHGMKPYEQHE